MDDQEIIREIQAGNTELYSLLVEKYHRRLLNFIYRLVGDRSNVDDIGQEVFLSVYKAIREGRKNESIPFAALLFLAARNRSISEIRKRLHRKEVTLIEESHVGEHINFSGLNEQDEQMEILYCCLDQLDEPYRQTLLQSLKGETIEEIAEFHNIATGTVKSRVARAKEKLRKIVNRHLGGKRYERV